MENQELIVVKQLPIIEERLITIKDDIQKAVEHALSLECNEDTYKQIKTIRANMNKDFNALEDQRKELKKSILAPYEAFEKVYKECVSDVYLPGKAKLDVKISEVENGIKDQIRSEAVEFFEECRKSKMIDFIKFEDVGLNITMNASRKSIHEKIASFIDKVFEDLAMIDTQEYSAEILVEYKKTFNVSAAIIAVTNRKKAVEEEQERVEAAREARNQEAARAAEIDSVIEKEEPEFAAPEVQPIDDKEPEEQKEFPKQKFKVTFSVETYNLDDIKAIVALMRERGIHYEQL